MAVIREQRNFRIGPVGVTRSADTSEVNKSISESLSTVGQILYEGMARRAEDIGVEAGSSAIVIDPETGLPQPLVPPKGFGSIASDAYDRVARNRFESSIQTEIEVKGSELSGKFGNNRNGAALYHKSMSDYVESMVNAADGAGYKSYIQDTGMAYRDLTTTKLSLRQAERERAELIEFTKVSFSKGQQSAEALWATNTDEAQAISDASVQGISDAVDANLLPKSSLVIAETNALHTKARGIIRGLDQSTGSKNLRLIRAAFDNANPNLIPDHFEYLEELITDFGSDFEALEQLGSFVNEHLEPIESIAIQKEAEQKAQRIRKMNEAAYVLEGSFYLVSMQVERELRDAHQADAEFPPSRLVTLNIEEAKDFYADSMAVAFDPDGASAQLANARFNKATTILNSTAIGIIKGKIGSSGSFDVDELSSLIKILNNEGTEELVSSLSPESYYLMLNLTDLIKADKSQEGIVSQNVRSLLQTALTAEDSRRAIDLGATPAEHHRMMNYAMAVPATDEGIVDFKENFLLTMNSFQEAISGYNDSGLSDSANKQIQQRDGIVVGLVEGALNKLVTGLSKPQVDQLLANNSMNPEKSPTEESKAAIKMLNFLKAYYPLSGSGNIQDKYNSTLKSWSEGGAGFVEAKGKLALIQSQDGATATMENLDLKNLKLGGSRVEVFQNFNKTLEFIESIQDLKESEKNSSIDFLRAKAAKEAFQVLVATDLEPQELSKIIPYLKGTNDGEGIRKDKLRLLDDIKNYAQSSTGTDLIKTLSADFNGEISRIEATLKKDAEEAIKNNITREVITNGNLYDKAHQKVMQEFMVDSNINYRAYNAMDEEQQQIVLELFRSVPPSGFLEDVRNLATGQPVIGADSIMNLFSILSTDIDPFSPSGVNRFGDAIPHEHQELLKDAAQIKFIRGGKIEEIIGDLVMLRGNDNAKGNLKNALMSSDQTIISPRAFATAYTGDPIIGAELAGFVEYLGLKGSTQDMIEARLDAVIDQKYPKSLYIVDASRPVGDIKRSRFSLEAVIKNEDIREVFIKTVNDEVAELSAQLQKVLGPDGTLVNADFPNLVMRAEERKATENPVIGPDSIQQDILEDAAIDNDVRNSNNEGRVYLNPDNSGGSLLYRVYYADENGELKPLIYTSDSEGNPVAEGTEGSELRFAAYTITKTVGELIRQDQITNEIDKKMRLRANAIMQTRRDEAKAALQGGQAGMEDYVERNKTLERIQQFAPSEYIGR